MSDAGGALDLGDMAPQAARHHHSHPRTQHQSVLDAGAVGRTLLRVEKERGVGCAPGVVVVGSGGLLQVGFPGVDKPARGLSVIFSPRVVAWSATTGAVGRGQSEGATRQ